MQTTRSVLVAVAAGSAFLANVFMDNPASALPAPISRGDAVRFHDVDGDGVDDPSLFYELWPADGADDDSSIWYVDSTRVVRRWWQGGPGSWDLELSSPVSGDFNGDGTAEFAAVYDYPSMGSQAVWGFEDPAEFPRLVWMSGEAGPIGASTTLAVSGDFDGDGDDDVALFGDQPSDQTQLFVIDGSTTGLSRGRIVWRSGLGNWDLSRTVVGVGDIEGDGDDDVVLLYSYDTDVVRLWAMPGTPGGLAPPLERWSSCVTCWNLDRTQLAVGDFDGDSIDDVGMIYDDGAARTSWWVIPGWDLADGGFPTVDLWWRSHVGAFDTKRAAYATGDVDGDGRDEVVAFYEYPGYAETRLWTLERNSPASLKVDVYAPPVWLESGGGWARGVPWTMFDWSRARLV